MLSAIFNSTFMTLWHTVLVALHLLAVSVWLGGIAFFLLVLGPAAHEVDPPTGARVLNRGRITLETISWTAIAVLLLTGIGNLVLQTHMTGARLGHYYVVILSVKLVLFAAMLVHHSLQVFKYGPEILRLTQQLDARTSVWSEPLRACWQRWFTLLKINAVLGPIVILVGLALAKS